MDILDSGSVCYHHICYPECRIFKRLAYAGISILEDQQPASDVGHNVHFIRSWHSDLVDWLDF
jgi:hypothetical protein